MNPSKPTRIVIVGGGTAGWLAAASLARLLGATARIELIESEAIGTVGVGEATIPQIRLLLQVLGINEDDFMRHTGATVKLGIEFEGWGDPQQSYMHAFGDIGRSVAHLPFHHYWLRGRSNGVGDDLWDHSFNLRAAKENRFARVPPDPAKGLDGLVYAYHFDASRVAVYLRHYAERLGVRRTEGMVSSVSLNPESGDIASLELSEGRTVEGDLYLDCSGFRALLIGDALGVEFDDWSRFLPCNRAVAMQCESTRPLLPYTRASAREAGWQWRIPLQKRTGNGYVYSSDFTTDEKAVETLLAGLDGAPIGDPRVIRFTTGMRTQFWKGNCIALGLASGFLEPLESTSIHLVQSGIDRLIKLFPGNTGFSAAREEYNRQTTIETDRIRDFLVLHYHVNRRDGSFWEYCRDMPLPDGLLHKLDLFRSTGTIVRETGDLFAEEAWLQVMIGQGIVPDRHHPMADRLTKEQLNAFLSENKMFVKQALNALTSHSEFIAQHCAEQ